MTQHQLNRQIAAVTGESIRKIARMGFHPLWIKPLDPDPEDLIVDWDDLERQRNVALCAKRPSLTRPTRDIAACY